MAIRWACVILGTSIPFVLLLTSNMALASGGRELLLIATFCAMVEKKEKKQLARTTNFFIAKILMTIKHSLKKK
jgi:hypothetical protein